MQRGVFIWGEGLKLHAPPPKKKQIYKICQVVKRLFGLPTCLSFFENIGNANWKKSKELIVLLQTFTKNDYSLKDNCFDNN